MGRWEQRVLLPRWKDDHWALKPLSVGRVHAAVEDAALPEVSTFGVVSFAAKHSFAGEQEVWGRLKSTYFPKRKLRTRPDQEKLTALAKQFTNPYRCLDMALATYLAQEPDTIEIDSTGNPATASVRLRGDLRVDFEVRASDRGCRRQSLGVERESISHCWS